MRFATTAFGMGLLRAGAVLLALGMLAGYVVYSQRRARPAVTEVAEKETFMPGSKSIDGLLVERGLAGQGDDNDDTIDLDLAPEVVEFEGFVNYGSPVNVEAELPDGSRTTLMLSSKNISGPIFTMRSAGKPEKPAAPVESKRQPLMSGSRYSIIDWVIPGAAPDQSSLMSSSKGRILDMELPFATPEPPAYKTPSAEPSQ